MVSVSSITIEGYNSEIVPNTFFKQHEKSEFGVIIYPGWGYTAQMPLLYYCINLMLSQKADVFTVDYEYNKRADFQSLNDKDKSHWFFTDVQAAYRSFVRQHTYKQILFIGKSIGTRAVGYLMTKEMIHASTKAVWLTPLLKDEKLRGEMKQYGGKSLFICGTADPHYDAKYMTEIQETTKGQVLLVNNADHLLNFKGDVNRSIYELGNVIDNIKTFAFD